MSAADPGETANDDASTMDEEPPTTQEMEADEPPLLRTLVGHVPITGATNGTRPPTSSSPTRISNIIRRDQPPPDPRGETQLADDDARVTTPHRVASPPQGGDSAPPESNPFERDGEGGGFKDSTISSVLAAAAQARDLGVARPILDGEPAPLGPPPRPPPGPDSVEIEIVRPYLEPGLGGAPPPPPPHGAMPEMAYMRHLPPPYPGAPQARPAGGRTALKMLLVVVLLGSMAAGGYFGYMALFGEEEDDSASATAKPAGDPGEKPAPVAAPADAAPATVAGKTADAGAVTPAPAAADAGAAPPPAAGNALSINSTPPDAKVYLDGAPVGKTPLKLDATGWHPVGGRACSGPQRSSRSRSLSGQGASCVNRCSNFATSAPATARQLYSMASRSRCRPRAASQCWAATGSARRHCF